MLSDSNSELGCKWVFETAQSSGLVTVRTVRRRASSAQRAAPADEQLEAALWQVRLGSLLERLSEESGGRALDCVADWAGMLSVGEQQRLAFARCDTACSFAPLATMVLAAINVHVVLFQRALLDLVHTVLFSRHCSWLVSMWAWLFSS